MTASGVGALAGFFNASTCQALGFFRDCLQGRPTDPKPRTNQKFWVLKTSASAAFGENFRLLTPFLEILEPMESPFKELSNAPLISS